MILVQRSKLMQAFLMQDVDAAKIRIQERKHRERVIRPSGKQRKRHIRVADVPMTAVLYVMAVYCCKLLDLCMCITQVILLTL